MRDMLDKNIFVVIIYLFLLIYVFSYLVAQLSDFPIIVIYC